MQPVGSSSVESMIKRSAVLESFEASTHPRWSVLAQQSVSAIDDYAQLWMQAKSRSCLATLDDDGLTFSGATGPPASNMRSSCGAEPRPPEKPKPEMFGSGELFSNSSLSP